MLNELKTKTCKLLDCSIEEIKHSIMCGSYDKSYLDITLATIALAEGLDLISEVDALYYLGVLKGVLSHEVQG